MWIRVMKRALLGVQVAALMVAGGCKGKQATTPEEAQAQGKAFGMKQAEFMKQKMQSGTMPGTRSQGGPATQ
ncbi:MAG TPA: hypothetical protein PLD23_08060 [Armatimonadota bacterium]|mgnify:CR=1 FL=1|nr:hypothetical protein [Armatimonadota bacterium]HQK93446.1 hypothetical protein [Armatimonadota bacterium]